MYMFLYRLAQCNSINTDSIINFQGEWPFLVSIQLEIQKEDNSVVRAHICGGSILDRYHILTASHCFDVSFQ